MIRSPERTQNVTTSRTTADQEKTVETARDRFARSYEADHADKSTAILDVADLGGERTNPSIHQYDLTLIASGAMEGESTM